jgi:3-dehydroquinate synthase
MTRNRDFASAKWGCCAPLDDIARLPDDPPITRRREPLILETAATTVIQIDCQLQGGSYPVFIKPGLLADVGDIVRAVAPSQRCTLAVDANISRSHGAVAKRSLASSGFVVNQVELAATESAKSPLSVTRIHGSMLRSRHERSSPLVAMGGGIVGDMAGFAAATFHRGVPLVHVPTTLLAMVDAAIGGKTAVNLGLDDEVQPYSDEPPLNDAPAAQLVKNVVGAFHQPRAVVIDPALLRTLEQRELRCGLAECIKHALLADADLLDFIEGNVAAILKPDLAVVSKLIERSVSVKVAFVEDDSLETTGRRTLLNLGHTFAHAIEPIEALALKHGEAVAIGLCAAANLAMRLGSMTAGTADRIRGVVAACGLPVRLTEPLLAGPLVDAMASDKKVQDARARLVVPLEEGGAELRDDVARSAIEAAWASVGAE